MKINKHLLLSLLGTLLIIQAPLIAMETAKEIGIATLRIGCGAILGYQGVSLYSVLRNPYIYATYLIPCDAFDIFEEDLQDEESGLLKKGKYMGHEITSCKVIRAIKEGNFIVDQKTLISAEKAQALLNRGKLTLLNDEELIEVKGWGCEERKIYTVGPIDLCNSTGHIGYSYKIKILLNNSFSQKVIPGLFNAFLLSGGLYLLGSGLDLSPLAQACGYEI